MLNTLEPNAVLARAEMTQECGLGWEYATVKEAKSYGPLGAAPSSNCRSGDHELCHALNDQAVRCTCAHHGKPHPDSSMPAAWTHADAWVMTAVAGAAEPTLSHVIAYGDACTHAIFTDEELAIGVGRLVASNLMEPAASDRLTLTPAGVELAGRRRGGMFGQVSSVLRLLSRVELVEGRWEVEPDSIAAGVRAYQDRARRH